MLQVLLGCGMNEQLLGAVKPCLMKCDGHQFVSVELTHVGDLCVLLSAAAPASVLANENSPAHTAVDMALTETPHLEHPAGLGLRRILWKCQHGTAGQPAQGDLCVGLCGLCACLVCAEQEKSIHLPGQS